MLISAFLSEEGGGFFSPPIPQAVQLSCPMQKGNASFALGIHFKSEATFLCLSIARCVEGVTNTAEQALDNFRFFTVSYLIGKMWVDTLPVMKLSYFMFFVIKVDTVMKNTMKKTQINASR